LAFDSTEQKKAHYVYIQFHTYIYIIYLLLTVDHRQYSVWMEIMFLCQQQTLQGKKYQGINIHFTWKMELIDHDPATYLQGHFCCLPLIRLETLKAMWASLKSQ